MLAVLSVQSGDSGTHLTIQSEVALVLVESRHV